MESNNKYHSLAALIHLSTFSKYFILLGNFIFPLIIWFSGRKERLIDEHGKQALNFQLSIFFYMVLIIFAGLAGVLLLGAKTGFENLSFPEDLFSPDQISLAIPMLTLITVAGVLLLGLFIFEVACVIAAAMKASEGAYYKYPLTINFISSRPVEKASAADSTSENGHSYASE